MAFHDLTTEIKPPANLRSLLGLGLKFCPTPRYTTPARLLLDRTMSRLRRDLQLRAYFAGAPPDGDYEMRYHVPSRWTPPHWTNTPEVMERLRSFQWAAAAKHRKRRAGSNLLPHQRLALSSLRRRTDLLVVTCDKNLGPAIIEKTRYIQLAFRDHLGDPDTYRQLTPTQLSNHATRLRTVLRKWIDRHKASLGEQELKFLRYHLRHNKTPFPVFYATMKVHKASLKTRPIVSCSGSLLHPIGVWVDRMLQQVAQRQQSFFKSSFALKTELVNLQVPPSTTLFIADAVSMYTNIDTTYALHEIGAYLRRHRQEYQQVPMDALIEALRIVMTNNIFTFGDTAWRQRTGTAMGTPPAPPYATLFFAIHEDALLAEFKDNLFLYRRYIDDVFGLWTVTDPGTDADTWARFQTRLNAFHGLPWDVSDRSTTVDYMDLTVVLDGGRLHTTLFEKALNLHLYIPPHSAHPPGVLNGLVMGMVHRIHTLCSRPGDIRALKQQFLRHLLARGYKHDALLPLFRKAAAAALAYTGPLSATSRLDDTVFYHTRYHPDDPSSHTIQSLWRDEVAHPPGCPALADVSSTHTGATLGVDRLIVAYSRPPNLGNLLSYRRLPSDTGPLVSSFATGLQTQGA